MVRIPLLKSNGTHITALKEWLATKGHFGSLLLGMLFALAFCPYSAVLFFGAFVPLMLSSSEGLLLALGTSLPVIVFSVLIAYSMLTVATTFATLQHVEVWLRRIVARVFLIVGLYHG